MDSAAVTARVFESPYMHWAKTQSRAQFNLATSGVPGYPLRDLDVTLDDLEINGSDGYGYPPLREAIAARYGVPAECIVAGGGTSGANAYSFLLLLGPGDEALVEFPAYDILTNLARYTGATVKRFLRRRENGWRVDPDDIARLMTPNTKLIVLTNLHNPSGALLADSELQEIGGIAASQGAHVLVDEVYLDCVWDRPVRSSFHLGPNFVATGSLTKIYGLSGIRCGWIFAPPEIAQRIWRLSDLLDSNPSHPSELLGVKAFAKLDQIRDRSRRLIETNREVYAQTAQRHGWDVPRYGTVAFPRVCDDSSEPLCRVLRERYSTTVVPGAFFEMPEHIRISLVSQTDILREGLTRVEAAITQQR